MSQNPQQILISKLWFEQEFLQHVIVKTLDTFSLNQQFHPAVIILHLVTLKLVPSQWLGWSDEIVHVNPAIQGLEYHARDIFCADTCHQGTTDYRTCRLSAYRIGRYDIGNKPLIWVNRPISIYRPITTFMVDKANICR